MKSGFTYFIIVSLLICLFPSDGNASIKNIQTVSFDKEIVCTYENVTPAAIDKLITHVPIFLFRDVAIHNNDSYVSKFRILPYLSSGYNHQKKLLHYLFLSSQPVPVDKYCHPSGYYIYALEKMRI